MKSIFKLILLAVLTFYVLLANASDKWDDNIAYRLAVASACSYEVGNGIRSITTCFSEAARDARKAGSDVLDVFNGLSGNEVALFEAKGRLAEVTGSLADDKLHAAILVKIPDGLILAFRGTKGKLDWLNNLSFTSLSDLEKLTLHERGTYHGFDQPLKDLIVKIRQNSLWRSHENQKDKTLYITGHSKGGAMATGAAVDLGPDNIFSGKKVTYTFEAARFFTPRGQQGNESILDKIWRFEYLYDIVPHLPLGKITRQHFIEMKKDNPGIFKAITIVLSLEDDWLEANNFNFVPSGKLAYVDAEGIWNDHTQDSEHADYYKDRAWELLGKTVFRRHPVDYAIDQHSECYLAYLRAKALGANIKASLADKKYCLE